MRPDGPRVVATTREARLYCLDAQGTEAWKTDFLEGTRIPVGYPRPNHTLATGYSTGLLKQSDGNRYRVL